MDTVGRPGTTVTAVIQVQASHRHHHLSTPQAKDTVAAPQVSPLTEAPIHASLQHIPQMDIIHSHSIPPHRTIDMITQARTKKRLLAGTVERQCPCTTRATTAPPGGGGVIYPNGQRTSSNNGSTITSRTPTQRRTRNRSSAKSPDSG